MKVWSIIFNVFGILVLFMFGAYYINISEVVDAEFQQLRYEYAVRQATEAMFLSTLQAEDIQLDYTTMDYISIDSSEAIEIFDRVMCFNYDMSPSDENFALINQNIAACAIAGYDGFYITEMVESDEIEDNGTTVDGYSLRFSPKIPYYLDTGNQTYAIDTYRKTYIAMQNNNHSANPTIYYDGLTLPAGVSEEDVTLAINTQIRGRLLNEIASSDNALMHDFEQLRMYFPEDTTSTGVNPFGVPGIIVIMHGAEFAGTEGASTMAVAGYKVVTKTNVIAFTDTRTNRSYYCYESQLRDEEKTSDSGGIAVGGTFGPFKIENYYDSIQEACMNVSPTSGRHYDPYYDILVRKITRD